MGFIYQIKVNNELYIGSTKYKYLCQRQKIHNHVLNNPNRIDYNSPLYKFCREKKVKKIICELLETVEDSKLRILEQEYINKLEPTLNTNRAYRTEEERIEQKRLDTKKHNNMKSNCPICNKEMLKNNIKRHNRIIHNI
jgi:hypothetical protein